MRERKKFIDRGREYWKKIRPVEDNSTMESLILAQDER